MEYRIEGKNLPVVIITCKRGETIFTESGGMAWYKGPFSMNTNTGGGLLKGLSRMLAGESLMITDYVCQQDGAEIAFASSFPGVILPVELGPGEKRICQKDAFLCAEKSVDLDIHFTKRLGSGLFGGEGFILQQLTGPGTAFVEIDGAVMEYELAAGEEMRVDTGHIAMMEPSVSYEIEMVRGFSNIVFGGEGLFLARLRGPGKVWLQTMPMVNLAQRIIPFIPKKD